MQMFLFRALNILKQLMRLIQIHVLPFDRKLKLEDIQRLLEDPLLNFVLIKVRKIWCGRLLR